MFQGVEAALDYTAPAAGCQRRAGNSTSHCGLVVQGGEGQALFFAKNMDRRTAGIAPVSCISRVQVLPT
jgi:hypothetical protein